MGGACKVQRDVLLQLAPIRAEQLSCQLSARCCVSNVQRKRPQRGERGARFFFKKIARTRKRK